VAETQPFVGTLVVTSCGKCGVTFGMPEDFVAERRKDHATFYCPNGDPRAYLGENEAERLRRLLDNANQALTNERREVDRVRLQREGVSHQLRATRGVVTRIKNRIARGVCPCCHRSFGDLRAHMDTQHPGFAETR